MMYLNLAIEVAATTAKDVYFPVPCRGNISKTYVVYSEETDEDETVTFARDTTTVNLFTPAADATAEGVVGMGVPDTTNKALIFDPASSTAAYKRIKISVPNTFDSAGMLGIIIEYDDAAYVEQTSIQAQISTFNN